MPNYVQNHIQLEGPREEILKFREIVDGQNCCGFSLCLHTLNRIAFPEEVPDWAADLELADEDKFDRMNCSYSVYSAWYSILPLVLKASSSFPGIRFAAWSNDLCAGCGYEYHMFGAEIQDGRASEMYHRYWTEYETDNVDQTIPIASADEFAHALDEPLGHWRRYSSSGPKLEEIDTATPSTRSAEKGLQERESMPTEPKIIFDEGEVVPTEVQNEDW